jgi:phospholipid/cholesterol/gamma-HCH transport system substrate-binding protein
MSTTDGRKSVIVGLFVFIGIAIVVAGVLTLGGQKKTFVKSVHVVAVFRDVNGLAVGNNVWFSGVKIGTIRNIRFSENDNVIVEMSIEERVKSHIRKNARAKISSDGLIGNKIVVIFGGTPDSAPIEDHTQLGVENIFNSDEMLSTLQANNKNLLAITNDIKGISDKIVAGKGSIGKMLNDESMYANLQSSLNNFKKASSSASEMTDNLSAYTAKLKAKGTLADDLVSDTVIFSRLRATVAEMNAVAGKANTIIDNLSQASAQVNTPNNPIGTLLNDKQAAADLKATLSNLSAGSQKLDENMEALQHNFLLRGFFRKKAKRENNNK